MHSQTSFKVTEYDLKNTKSSFCRVDRSIVVLSSLATYSLWNTKLFLFVHSSLPLKENPPQTFFQKLIFKAFYRQLLDCLRVRSVSWFRILEFPRHSVWVWQSKQELLPWLLLSAEVQGPAKSLITIILRNLWTRHSCLIDTSQTGNYGLTNYK